jgi:hypothetical protein
MGYAGSDKRAVDVDETVRILQRRERDIEIKRGNGD